MCGYCFSKPEASSINKVDEKSILEYVTLLWSLMLLVLHAIFFPYGFLTHLGLFFQIITCFAGIATLQSPKRSNAYQVVTSVLTVLTSIIFTIALLLLIVFAFNRPFTWPILMPMFICIFEITASILMAIKHMTKCCYRLRIRKQKPIAKEKIVMAAFDEQTGQIHVTQLGDEKTHKGRDAV